MKAREDWNQALEYVLSNADLWQAIQNELKLANPPAGKGSYLVNTITRLFHLIFLLQRRRNYSPSFAFRSFNKAKIKSLIFDFRSCSDMKSLLNFLNKWDTSLSKTGLQ